MPDEPEPEPTPEGRAVADLLRRLRATLRLVRALLGSE